MSEAYQITDADRHMVAVRLRPEAAIRQALPRMTRDRRLALFDHVYELAENVARLPGGLTDGRKAVRTDLFDFAWRLNDIVVDLHARLRNRIAGRIPPGGYELAKARKRHKVPALVNGIHVSVALKTAYRLAAPGACIVIEQHPDFETYDLRFLAGLNVQILATGCDLWFGDVVARQLAADGAQLVTMRRLDAASAATEILFNGGRQWGM